MAGHKDLKGTDLHISKITRGAGSPVGVVTPTVAGEMYFDTTNKNLWNATGLTSSDWESGDSEHKAETVSYQVTASRDISLADGTQTISLIAGRTARKVSILANISGTTTVCWGVAASNSQGCVALIEGGAGTMSLTTALYIRTSSGNHTLGTVTIESGQIKIAWAKTGSPTGAVNMVITADYHD